MSKKTKKETFDCLCLVTRTKAIIDFMVHRDSMYHLLSEMNRRDIESLRGDIQGWLDSRK
jgi:hypothetical protein